MTEAESGVLADAAALANFLKVAPVLITSRPDDDPDPKNTLLSLARRSGVRRLRQEMISTTDSNKAGTGYNDHLQEFVRDHWNPREAMQGSPSLARAVGRIEELKS